MTKRDNEQMAGQNNIGRRLQVGFLFLTVAVALQAQSTQAPALLGPDERYKADILLIVAHPDDETGDVAGYLARAIYDQQRRVAVIFITRGEEGSNEVGAERGDALGAVREIEGRKALASLGVTNVWFLNAPNCSSQDVLRALERWDHGSVLGQVVRLVRLTRPEVILTWLPAFVAGENHADHQASSVIANEAFDLAGDPSAFGEQLGMETGEGKSPEGLQPWQPKKIYYYSDVLEYPGYWLKRPPLRSPFRAPFLEGKGPVYANTEISETRHVPFSWWAAEESSFYLSQDGKAGKDAIEKQDFKAFEEPVRFVFGKSLVGGSITADVFDGIAAGPVPFVRAPRSEPQKLEGVTLELGGPWAFYREFWRAHNIEHLARLLPVSEVAIAPGVGFLRVPLLLHNGAAIPQEVSITTTLPDGWSEKTPFTTYHLMPGETYPVQTVLAVADPSKKAWQEIIWRTRVADQKGASVVLRVYTGANGAMPQ